MGKNEALGRRLLGDLKLYSDYLKWDENKGRYETWNEACKDVLETHILKYGEKVRPLVNEALPYYQDQIILASQRNLQFRKQQILNHNSRMFNCLFSYCYTPDIFEKGFYQLLCGCGLGVSLRNKFIKQLPKIHKRNNELAKTFIIPDSIEGWGQAVHVLLSSYCKHPSLSKKYFGHHIKFDYSQIRPKGSYISGGFKAPGHEGLKQALERIEALIEKELGGNKTIDFRSIIAYDIFMHVSDATLAGGVRRSAMNIIMDEDDEEMVYAKTGDWRENFPWRARSNNSIGYIRNKFAKEQFNETLRLNKGDNDVGYVFCNDENDGFNPCQPSWATVLTPEGVKQLWEVGVEDKIWSETGWTTIVAKWRSGTKDVYEYKTKIGAFYGTKDHKIVSNGEKVKVGEADSIDCFYTKDKISNYKIIRSEYVSTEYVYDITVDNETHTYWTGGCNVSNCFEIGFNFYNQIEDYNYSAFQGCNLNSIIAPNLVDKEGNFDEKLFYEACRKAAILGTLQAGYTDFPNINTQTEKIFEGEALLGVSINGWMQRPELFNEEILNKGAQIVKDTNKEVADKIGINYAARTTCVKPAGNETVITKIGSSGITPGHSLRGFRIMQQNKNSEIGKYLYENMPYLIEESVWSSTNSDYVVYAPYHDNEEGIYKSDMQGVEHLEYIKMVQNSWVASGKEKELCYNPNTMHNVSNTVIIDDYDEITEYLFNNQDYFTAVSFVSEFSDKDYNQSPFTSVLDSQQLLNKYGNGVLFASGLVVDGLHYYGDLWEACATLKNKQKEKNLEGSRDQVLLKKDWLRRARKFSKNYFGGDVDKMIYCLKDTHLWHKYNTITRKLKEIPNFSQVLTAPEYNDIDTMGAIACSAGQCEI